MAEMEGTSALGLNDTWIPWAGHLPATRAALDAIRERTASGHGAVSLHERVLESICAFRAVTATGMLRAFLRTNPAAKLSEARFALNEIGAMNVAVVLSKVILGLQRTSSPDRQNSLFIRLERDLLAIGQYVDNIIAQYAAKTHDYIAPTYPLQDGDH